MKSTYVKTKLNTTLNVSKIITIHYYEFNNSFSYAGESHDFWEMVYIDKGKVEITSGDDTIVLGQEGIFFHKPNEFHSIRAYDSAPNFFVISFECNSPYIKHFEGFHTQLSKHLKPIISSIIAESDKTYLIPKNDINLKKLTLKTPCNIGGEQLIKIYLEQLLIMMLRDMLKQDETKIFPTREKMENHLVASIKSYVNEHVKEKINLCTICAHLGYSKSSLSKVFHDNTGYTIMNYVNMTKIDYAKTLLRDNDYNIAETSYVLSYDNPQYFSKVFKRFTGMSPSEFKLSLVIN